MIVKILEFKHKIVFRYSINVNSLATNVPMSM
jgi:hypothetical protein